VHDILDDFECFLLLARVDMDDIHDEHGGFRSELEFGVARMCHSISVREWIGGISRRSKVSPRQRPKKWAIAPLITDTNVRNGFYPVDNIGALNVFMIAAETRSFVRAGEALGVSSSAVGKTMARLEKRLGVRLFHRNTRSIAITAEGVMFLERCRRIFSEMEAAEQELSQTMAAPRGQLRVSLPLAGMLFMPTITKFMHSFPDVTIDLDFTDRLVDVIEEGFDAVVRTGEVTDSRLMIRTLGPETEQTIRDELGRLP